MSFGALLTGLSAIAPVIVAVAVVVVVSEGIKSAKPKTKSKDEKEQKEQKLLAIFWDRNRSVWKSVTVDDWLDDEGHLG